MFGLISEERATGRGDGNRAEHREFLLDLVVYGCALMNKNGYSVDRRRLKMHICHVQEAIRPPNSLSLVIKTVAEPSLRPLRVFILGLE